MNTMTTQATEAILDVLRSAIGVVDLVDGLFSACVKEGRGIRLQWRTGGCFLRPDGEPELLLETLRTKSQFRAVLARVAVVCNDRCPNSVSPHFGRVTLPSAANDSQVIRVFLVNTPEKQSLQIQLAWNLAYVGRRSSNN